MLQREFLSLTAYPIRTYHQKVCVINIKNNFYSTIDILGIPVNTVNCAMSDKRRGSVESTKYEFRKGAQLSCKK